MRSFRISIILSLFCCPLFGQVTHLTDLDLPGTPIYPHSLPEPLYFFVDGDLLITTYYRLELKETIVFNKATGEFTEAEYLITAQYQVGDEFIYFGEFPNFGDGIYLVLDESDNFSFIESLPARPSLSYNGKSYGMGANTLWEMSSNPLSSSAIASFAGAIGSFNNHSLYIADDTLHLSLPERYIMVSLLDGTVSEPYAAYFETHRLHWVPNTGIEGRHLYTSESSNEGLSFHELGRQMAPRILQTDETFHGEPSFWTASNRTTYFSTYPRGNLSNSGDYTWLNLENRGPVGPLTIQHNLIRVDRRPGHGGISLIHQYWRGRIDMRGGLYISAMGSGEKICAMGLLGPEGAEPYGYVNDSIIALKDFIPGGRGSVDRVLDVEEPNHVVNPEIFKWNHKTWFIAGHPHLGHELTYSDGTVEGTQVLADMVEGSEGIRTVRYAPQGESLFVLVQRDDFSFGIFEIGKNQEPFEPIANDPETWEVALGGFPEVIFFLYNNRSVQAPIAQGADGSLFYLTRNAPLGLIHGDGNDTYRFPEDNIPRGNILRLQKYGLETGELLFSKPFRDFNAEDLFFNNGMVVHPDGTIRVLLSSRGNYRDMELSTSATEIGQWGSNGYGLSLITFDLEGEFLSIQRLQHQERMDDVFEFHVLASGNMVIMAGLRNLFNQTFRYLLVFSPGGEVLHKKTFALQDQEYFDFYIGADQNSFFISRYGRQSDCDALEVRFFEFDENLREASLGGYCYTGEIIKPQLLITGNGDKWYTGAGNGTITFRGSMPIFLSPADANLHTTFSLLEPQQFPDIRNVQVISNHTSNYFGSFVRDGSIFLQSADITGADLNKDFNTTERPFFYFKPIATLDLNTTRLDRNGQISEMQSQKMKTSHIGGALNYRMGFLKDGSQWQYVSSRTHTLTHLDTLTPQPTYSRNVGYLAQLIKRPWLFGEESLNVEVTLPDAEGNFLSLHPNPSNGNFQIAPRNGNSVPFSAYEVFDMQGRLVSAGILPETFTQIQVVLPGKVSAGTYHVRFTGEGVSESARVMVIR